MKPKDDRFNGGNRIQYGLSSNDRRKRSTEMVYLLSQLCRSRRAKYLHHVNRCRFSSSFHRKVVFSSG